jgi:uncharacterized protein YecT (DUF1311 family)
MKRTIKIIMKPNKLLIFILFGLTLQTFGQEDHWIDIELKSCLAVDSNQTTAGMNMCTYEGEEKWDKELNKYYKLLMNNLDSAGQLKLKEAQRQWMKFRDIEFEFIGTYYYETKQGTMWTNVAAGSRYEFVKTRALELKAYYEILEY